MQDTTSDILLTNGHAVMMQFITTARDANYQAFSIDHLQQTDGTEFFFSWSERRKFMY
jgi:hypothetical protein